MKVLLVTVTSVLPEEKFIKVSVDGEGGYPIGVPYIQSYLKSKNHEVEYIDLILFPYHENARILLDKINSFQPDVIGFSVLTGNHINTFNLMEIVHNKYPKIRIVVGGIHATILYEQIITKFQYAIVVIGEGEITFSELLEERPLSSIDGIAYFSNEQVIKTKNRELIYNLDILPFPEHARITSEHKMANMLTSRGCPQSCSFCALNPNAKRIRRVRSAKNVVDEVEYIIKKYPNINLIYFMDDALLVDSKRVIEICNEIIKRNLNHISYQCQARVKPFNKEVVPYLEKANFRDIYFGLETANESMLKRCHKSITQQDVTDVVTAMKDSKIKITLFLIIGLPGETLDTIKETASFIQKMQKIKYIMYFNGQPPLLSVFAGTEVYEIMKVNKKIDDNYWPINNMTPSFTAEHSIDELNKLKEELCNRISFMPLSLNRLIHQYHMIPYVIKYTLRYYSSNPISFLREFIKKR